ncbi:molybdopterin-guanine dinucleotide biosynthesis protein MobA [Pseudoruegeria aquimaris]|uniref:Molybdopterin-guanine dinucleotide biosynthesis protein MobA n=1 Tax=Pseudoruegeria aquimaris TaxID=393663 RepID=A0A1Y5RI96_9RHOB|nr:nucleotidyltransferase family protein [Pseudoruegeria aquimaris]SLN17888.1 molybdopterin-guanine dinucleotide biosynthesis protein MobA [Pseudoruegeria aquimaris]
MDIITFFPAAGASSRMRGADKLARRIDGVPLLRRQVGRAREAGGPVWVSLPAADHPRAALLDGLDVRVLIVEDAREGMAASLRALARSAPEGARAMIALPDMPDIETGDFAALRAASEAAPEAIIRATSDAGAPGHPVVLPADLVPRLADLTGDGGARSLLKAEAARVRPLPLAGDRALVDLDTPEAWASWLAGRPGARPA